MRIFIGFEDIASTASGLKKGFSRLNIETYVVSLESRLISANEVDKVIAVENFWTKLPIPSFRLQQFLRTGIRRRRLLREAAEKFDTFIFITSSFYGNSRDMEYLKSIGKNIVVLFMGSEQRWKNSYTQEMKSYGIPSYYGRLEGEYDGSLKKLGLTLSYLRNVEKYADVIYSLPNHSQLSLRPYNQHYIPVNTETITEKPQQKKIPVVLHAPSKRSVKGTDFVLKAFEKLKNNGIEFEIRLVENVPHLEAVKMYGEADIAVDQLFVPSGGKFARELLAAGKVVLSSVRREYIDNIPSDCPIIDVNPDNIYDELEKIIPDYERRVELAKKGRPFVEKYHDINLFCKDILKKLETPLNNREFEFYPTFFREKFVPESEKHIKLYNYWTQFVSTTDWYKKYVPEGTRDGLIF